MLPRLKPGYDAGNAVPYGRLFYVQIEKKF
jgi:hypothetical protein